MKEGINIKDYIEEALSQMLIDYSVFAQLIVRIGYKVINDTTTTICGWTDGKTIYINTFGIETINKTYPIDKKQIIFILAHELGHIILLDWDREKAMNIPENDQFKRQCWRLAEEYEVNGMLHDNTLDGKPRPIGKLPSFACYEARFKNMTAEEIYKILLTEKENTITQMYLNAADASDITKHSSILDTVETKLTKEKLTEIIKQSSDKSSGLNRIKENYLKKEKFNWKKALSKYIRNFMKSNYTWNKPNRAGIAQGLILPSASFTSKIKIAVAIDTSGSVTENDLQTLLNHVYTITQQFKHYSLDVWCFSTTVHENTFKSFNEKNHDFKDFKLNSYGGTNISSNFTFVKEHYKSNKPDVLIVFSDFYDKLDGDTTTRFTYCPCIWLVINHKNFVKPSLIKAEQYFYDKGE